MNKYVIIKFNFLIKLLKLLLILIFVINCRSEKDIEPKDYNNSYLTFKVEKGNPVNFNLISISKDGSSMLRDVFINRNKTLRFNLLDNSYSDFFYDEILKNFIYYKFQIDQKILSTQRG